MFTGISRRALGVAGTVAVALLASGCGGSDHSADDGASTPDASSVTGATSTPADGAPSPGSSVADQPGQPSSPASRSGAPCSTPVSGFDPAKARETAYNRAVTSKSNATTSMTLGLVTPKTSSLPRQTASGGVYSADASDVFIVEIRAKLTQGAMGLIWSHQFTMVGPGDRACRQVDQQALPGSSLMAGQASVGSGKTLQEGLAFEVPKGADPKDYRVYFHPDKKGTPVVWSYDAAQATAAAPAQPRKATPVKCSGKATRAAAQSTPTSSFGSPARVSGPDGASEFTLQRPRVAKGQRPYWLSGDQDLVYVPFTAKALSSGGRPLAYTDFTLFDASGRTCARTSMQGNHALFADAFDQSKTYRNRVAFVVPAGHSLKNLRVAYSDDPDGPATHVWK